MDINFDSIMASLLTPALDEFQAWAIQNPDDEKSKSILPIISFVEGLAANEPTYLVKKRRALGPNFCCAGQVVMGEFETLEAALTSPQARTWRLGTTILDAAHAPNGDVGGRNVFLLSLSDEAAGGNGDHGAFRRCLQDYLLNESARARQKDDVAKGLLAQLATDYQQMPHGLGESFFTDTQQGLMRFMIRYLHYAIFGLSPDDETSMNLLADLHYDRLSPTHYMAGVGNSLEQFNLKRHGDLSELIEKAATLYETAPALANFREGQPEYHLMTRRELAKLMTSIMGIAALQGPLHLAYTAMGFRTFPEYPDQNTEQIDPTQYWDQLDLNDRDSIYLFLLECARLWAPVSATHRVATESFSVRLAGKEQIFPAGTKVLIPMSLGLLDEGFWGDGTYDLDPKRENLCPYHMGFHSVGDRSGGRICPGKDLAMEMLVDILITVGKARRA